MSKLRAADGPASPARGIYIHAGSGQYVARIGYELNAQTGRRVRGFQYLGHDPIEAARRNADLAAEWRWSKTFWHRVVTTNKDGPQFTLCELMRPLIPANIREIAELDKPVLLKREWIAQADKTMAAYSQNRLAVLAKALELNVMKKLDASDAAKKSLRQLNESADGVQAEDILALLPPDVQARVFAATQPTVLEAAGLSPSARRVTIAEARKLYLDDERSRVGLPDGGLKLNTFQNKSRFLDYALALQVANADGAAVPAMDVERTLDSLSFEDIERFKRDWMSAARDDKVALRTAKDYLLAFKYLLDWADRQSRIAYRHPANIAGIFKFRKVNPINIEEPKEAIGKIKELFGVASERTRLYVLLGLNCGFYQVDIGRMKLRDVRVEGRHTFIVRAREKTSHQNDFAGRWYLWPETAKLLKSHLANGSAETNSTGLALLNEAQAPLYTVKPNRARVDNIESAFDRAMAVVNKRRVAKGHEPMAFAFKQLRKVGATMMDRIGGPTARRLYKAGTLTDGDAAYVRNDFDALTKALKAWGSDLRRAGLFAATAAPKTKRP